MSDSALKDRIQTAVKEAMRSGDRSRLGVLRLITAAMKQHEVDQRTDLTDDDVTALLSKMVKQRHESIEQYRAANRDDLAKKEEYELTVLQEFLPQPLTDDEVGELIDQAMAESGAESIRDMGKVMGLLKPRLQGRADMGKASAQLKARLNG
ncbi:GatB/YqeY domain-containing protein [Aquisalimonas sp.]|uniref:GatB/YqeY domain-containing protein n=1 Tax=Aquisalimonas sp. TaxID=1872621 RepID=UPI0025BB092E|nr:GatB/YqeY domain-containing protein [Aquisalimonas sp.]